MNAKNSVSPEILGKVANLADLVACSPGAVVSKTLIDLPAGTITIFSLDAGQGLSEHKAPYDAFVEIIEGQATIRIGQKELVVSSGEAVIMPANVPHALSAPVPFKMLLVMIRSRKNKEAKKKVQPNKKINKKRAYKLS